jgi:hypothetical protein
MKNLRKGGLLFFFISAGEVELITEFSAGALGKYPIVCLTQEYYVLVAGDSRDAEISRAMVMVDLIWREYHTVLSRMRSFLPAP